MKCPNCYCEIPDNCNFCPSCGRKIAPTSPFDVSFKEARRAKRKATENKVFKVIAVIFAVLVAVVIIDAIRDDIADSGLTPIAEPKSGEILSGESWYDYYVGEGGELSEMPTITVTASNSASCVVKLKNSADEIIVCFYVRAGDTVSVNVPPDDLYVYFASGKTWYGEDLLFGENTSYSMDDEIQNFRDYTIEYTLYPVSDGNFSQTPIDKEDF